MTVMGRCRICNCETNNHHYYCDEHYPKDKYLVTNLRNQIKIRNDNIERLEKKCKRLIKANKLLVKKNRNLIEQIRRAKDA